MMQEVELDTNLTFNMFFLHQSNRHSKKQCEYEIVNKTLEVKHHTSFTDIVRCTDMFRQGVLPIIGLEDTVKVS